MIIKAEVRSWQMFTLLYTEVSWNEGEPSWSWENTLRTMCAISQALRTKQSLLKICCLEAGPNSEQQSTSHPTDLMLGRLNRAHQNLWHTTWHLDKMQANFCKIYVPKHLTPLLYMQHQQSPDINTGFWREEDPNSARIGWLLTHFSSLKQVYPHFAIYLFHKLMRKFVTSQLKTASASWK